MTNVTRIAKIKGVVKDFAKKETSTISVAPKKNRRLIQYEYIQNKLSIKTQYNAAIDEEAEEEQLAQIH